MKTRACCIALIVTACVASPYACGDSNAKEREVPVTRATPAELAVLNAPDEWTHPEWQLQLLDPSLQDMQRRSRNPAGRLVLPAPQTSHAPAF
jgi:hypothetical protein